ncbi:hypothetical protein [Viscerimonas tarda]
MNKLVLSLILLLSATTANSQKLPYKPLSSFSKDTTAYIMYNFWDREYVYAGKTLEEVLYYYGMPVNDMTILADVDNPDVVLGFNLSCYNTHELNNRKREKRETNSIRIYLEKKLKMKDGEKIYKKFLKSGWKPVYKRFRKDKIRSAKAIVYIYSPYYEKYKDKE